MLFAAVALQDSGCRQVEIAPVFRDWASPLADKAREVIDWYFAEVPKLNANVCVSEAEKRAAKAMEHA